MQASAVAVAEVAVPGTSAETDSCPVSAVVAIADVGSAVRSMIETAEEQERKTDLVPAA